MKAIFKSHRAELFLDMVKIGCIGFGGGNALIPVMQEILVDKRRTISQESFEEDILIASVTPGALPVEIAGGAGARADGWRGMLLAAVGMALPGVLATLLLLSALSSATEALTEQVTKLSVGVMAFVLCLLTDYVVKTYRKARNKCLICAIILVVFFLTGVKNLFRLWGLPSTFLPSLMAIHVFIMMFFLTFYVHGNISAPKIVTAGLICLLYAAGLSAPDDVPAWRLLTVGAEGLMGLLSVYGALTQRKAEKMDFERESYRNILLEVKAECLFAAALSLPALCLFGKAFLYLANGLLSSFLSFGGGDAYLTVADGLFVNEGLLDSGAFYGRIVPIVNLLPGSILCKTLAAVGYFIGMEETGSAAAGLLLALGGFACSVTGSCLSFSAMKYAYRRFGTLSFFELMRKGIRPVVSGLMLTVMVSMLRQGSKVDTGTLFINGFSLLLAEWALACFLKFAKKWENICIVLFLSLLSLALCNASLVFGLSA